jgi:hypothetical protein
MSDSNEQSQDVPPSLDALEQKVLGDAQLSRLAGQWMLGTSRSLEDFITYNRHLIDAAGTGKAPASD